MSTQTKTKLPDTVEGILKEIDGICVQIRTNDMAMIVGYETQLDAKDRVIDEQSDIILGLQEDIQALGATQLVGLIRQFRDVGFFEEMREEVNRVQHDYKIEYFTGASYIITIRRDYEFSWLVLDELRLIGAEREGWAEIREKVNS